MTEILLIDDDPLITEPLTRLLPQHGYKVAVAHNGLDGLVEALTGEHAVVVLDVMMPDMDGWEVCRRLRQECVVLILMLTALGDEVDRILGLELGADDYLTKPFSSRELIARIKALLRRVALDKANFAQTTTTMKRGISRLIVSTSLPLSAPDAEGGRDFSLRPFWRSGLMNGARNDGVRGAVKTHSYPKRGGAGY